MCGFAGFLGGAMSGGAEALLQIMGGALVHRGPDDGGTWWDGLAGIGLAHRRLSILDLSPTGHQPMVSPCRRFVVAYNGEIYNHLDLRAELDGAGAGFNWRGHSDTETLLSALRHWGIEGALQRLNGMFAFALWDAAERTLFLARDRMGEKPLYYGRCGDTFLFGSGTEGARQASCLAGRDRSRRAGAVPAAQLFACAVEHLPRHPQAATSALSGGA